MSPLREAANLLMTLGSAEDNPAYTEAARRLHREADAAEEVFCDACGNLVVRGEGGVWIDPSVPEDAAPDLCLLNEYAEDRFGPHAVTR